jgi:hypothetical protein
MLPVASYTLEAIEAWGTVGGAIATFAAVVVALWQSLKSNRAKLKVESGFLMKTRDGGRRARREIRLVGTNHGPQSIRIEEAALSFVAASGTIIGLMTAGGDELPKTLAKGEKVEAKWDLDKIEDERVASNGEPFKEVSFLDAFGKQYSALFPGATATRKHWLFRRKVTGATWDG